MCITLPPKTDHKRRQTAKRIFASIPYNCQLLRRERYGEYNATESDVYCMLDENCRYVAENKDFPAYGNESTDLYVSPDYLSGGDYGNMGSVGASNYRLFLDEFAQIDFEDDYTRGNSSDYFNELDDDNPYLPDGGIIELSYGYGGYGVGIRLDVWLRRDDIRGCITSLEDYPCIDDEDVSFIEMQWADDSWDCWARDDFVKGLETKLGIDLEFTEEGEKHLRQYFEDCRESVNTYWEMDGGGHGSIYVDLDRIIKTIESLDWKGEHGTHGEFEYCLQDLLEQEVQTDE